MQNDTLSPLCPRIGITHGDFNGVGYEVILKTFEDARILTLLTPVLYGQSKVFSYYKKNFGIADFSYSLTRDARQAWSQKFNILNIVEDKLDIDPGKVTDLAGLMAVVSLEKGVDDLRNGHVDGLVLAPANPLNMKRDRYAYANQQQYLDAAFGVASSMLILVSDRVKIGMLTSHLPLREALEAVTTERVLQGIRGFAMSLKNDFGITAPKIAVLGLNPHAGMSEAFGREEVSLIEPALLQARNEDVFAFGPFAADTFFGSDAWLKYDGVLAMYHDQAMVPFQLLSAQGGAYCFSGLPAVCTAPVMECQYDLANQNVANPDAFRKALYLACDIVRQRAR